MVLWLILVVLVLILAALVWLTLMVAEGISATRGDLERIRSSFARGIDSILENTDEGAAFFKAIKRNQVIGLAYRSDRA